MTQINISHAKKVFDDVTVIPDLNITINEGELFTLLGPSGCGKTTLLRMIAGFNSIEGGDFYFDADRINDKDPSKRNIGMVFQNYAIFPHLTVRENVEFGLKQRKLDKKVVRETAEKYLKLIQMEKYMDRKPERLSGGQQQRVALARALAINPAVLLMDEPLSNLDAKLRVDMRKAIREIQREVGITTVYVTHDQEEAMAISDQIAVMKDGIVQQVGSPKALYHRPANEFVASFIGRTNIVMAELKHSNEGVAELHLQNGHVVVYPKLNHLSDQTVRVSIRPEDFIRVEQEASLNTFVGKIEDSVYLGLNTEYVVALSDGHLVQVTEESSFEEDLTVGEQIALTINTDKINVYCAEGLTNLSEVK
ncbi:ABC transporter ATP-binding protein [Halolactibacillus alkaliphilus]|uniref:ABC transporter ATP-binding protein n=1 Tax=Halolactibacillus alkaliphilus TaxID=442899 RepID=A0A511X3F4_9BACI|nr:ABC transporter ATP-binding protein [Halolactibacillus alkaliphilus]GEN57451.1 ABC transporter ATP-binding protein [Halolactibacillus alkaliphilus]GGN68404.1 ABC transporter ATP-binding protein [Halolactibacillus alkaliphilus]SFO95221.1 iron(III) transport system ATP-binding protein [Halolactibacillus alkaliphilus]